MDAFFLAATDNNVELCERDRTFIRRGADQGKVHFYDIIKNLGII